jgi:hypothetical protein
MKYLIFCNYFQFSGWGIGRNLATKNPQIGLAVSFSLTLQLCIFIIGSSTLPATQHSTYFKNLAYARSGSSMVETKLQLTYQLLFCNSNKE